MLLRNQVKSVTTNITCGAGARSISLELGEVAQERESLQENFWTHGLGLYYLLHCGIPREVAWYWASN